MNDNWLEIIHTKCATYCYCTYLPICIMCYSKFEFIFNLKKEEVIFSIIIIKDNMFSLFCKRRSEQGNAM